MGGGAYLFFLHSLMGKKKKNFAGATAPPSHYVAPPLVELVFGWKAVVEVEILRSC